MIALTHVGDILVWMFVIAMLLGVVLWVFVLPILKIYDTQAKIYQKRRKT